MPETKEKIAEREKIEALRPMSRLEFQILYSKCGSSGWVYGEFNETLYQQYLQRYGFFLCHILYLKNGKLPDEDGLITQLKKESDIFFIVDKDNLIHTISLGGTFEFYEEELYPSSEINWFFAEAPNTLETYVYNTKENKKTSPYYTGPNQIINDKLDWLQNKIVVLDFFPFPIIMSTDIRKDVVEEGYTFRMHLSEYFKPLFENVKKLFDATTPAIVHLIAPPYTSVHAIYELEDYEWMALVRLNDESHFKIDYIDEPYGFDKDKTPEKILTSFSKIRKKEFDDFKEKFNMSEDYKKGKWENIIVNYKDMCQEVKKRIYSNDSSNPGIKK